MFICCCVILGLDSSGGQQNQTNFEQYGESINFLRGIVLDITGTNDSKQTSRTEPCILRSPINDQEYFSVSIYLVSLDVKECLNNRALLSIIMKIVIRLQSSETISISIPII